MSTKTRVMLTSHESFEVHESIEQLRQRIVGANDWVRLESTDGRRLAVVPEAIAYLEELADDQASSRAAEARG